MSAALVVSIGTTHPQNVAGLGRDARVAADYGAAHASIVAAVSAQDERGVHGIFVLPPDFVRAQLCAIDFTRARAVRVGALGSAEIAAAVCEILRQVAVPIVFDPALAASAGGALYEGDALEAVRAVLAGTHAIVTPNLDEAQRLTSCAIESVDDMIAAARQLVEQGASAALVTGGHLPGEPVDVLVRGGDSWTFADTRLPQKMRGTGCALAMALACELARGRDLVAAVKGARAYVRTNIARS
ncbi:MAG TPA: PfkB family carbohydrate kinase [Candidatus Baltobacteraceae bacterium]|nr:PfkB family carbohydrate kinase [Candidatus Baltobacteraceae bacterium]